MGVTGPISSYGSSLSEFLGAVPCMYSAAWLSHSSGSLNSGGWVKCSSFTGPWSWTLVQVYRAYCSIASWRVASGHLNFSLGIAKGYDGLSSLQGQVKVC